MYTVDVKIAPYSVMGNSNAVTHGITVLGSSGGRSIGSKVWNTPQDRINFTPETR